MSSSTAHISKDRECDHCGYNLKGLPEGGKCPECGKSIRRRSTKTSGTMSDEAPTRFIKMLRLGFTLASVAILGSILLRFFNLGFIASGFWVAGIWLVTMPRPGKGTIRPDKVLDNKRLRDLIRYASLSWPVYSLASLGLVIADRMAAAGGGGGTGILGGLLTVVLILSGLVAWLSLIPTSVYFAELSYWASHDNLANRLRGTAWTLAVFGSVGAVLTGLAIGAGSGVAVFLGIFVWIVVAVALFVFGLTTIQLSTVMHWVIKHQEMAAGSAERVRQRVERESGRPGHIANGLTCQHCGYDLDGLPHGGQCPECGESYADSTPMPVRDPAKTPAYHDNSDIEIEQGESRGIYFNQELDARGKPKAGGVPYTPKIEIPEEGDIPLSMDDEEPPEDEDAPPEHADEVGDEEPPRG